MSKKYRKSNYNWLFLLTVIILALVHFYLRTFSPDSSPVPDIKQPGAGTIVDFSSASRKIHAAVDQGLVNVDLITRHIKEEHREIPHHNIEGTVRWHFRQLVVNTPATFTVNDLKTALDKSLSSTGGIILGSQTDKYGEIPAVRIDIGFRDVLAGKAITVITDAIYLIKVEDAREIQPGKLKGEMAIIIDDFGSNAEIIGNFISIGRPITFAILPHRSYSNETAVRALAAGYQIMLHLPMEPLSPLEEQEKTTIRVNMTEQEIINIVEMAVDSLPGIIGINNHQGSMATADYRVMQTVLGVVKKHNLFFVDSRTNSKSIAADMAKKMNIRTGENEIFIDNSSNKEDIKKQLRNAAQIALHSGKVTAIGHARPNTVKALKEAVPELESMGIRLIYVSQLLSLNKN